MGNKVEREKAPEEAIHPHRPLQAGACEGLTLRS